jgi:predicted O-methyltransferase YrrM
VSVAEQLSDAFGFLYADEVGELKRLARLMPPNPVVVNIGAGTGTSGVALMESRPDLHLITIDITFEVSPLGGLGNERHWMAQAGFGPDRWRQIHGDSKDVGRNWNDGPVDMVFIDGDHSEAGVFGDLYAWLVSIKPGGIFAFHDYHASVWPAVTRVVDRELRGYEVAGHVDTIKSFRIPERTLHVVGNPRSGNTWTNELMRQAVGDQYCIRKSHERAGTFELLPGDLVLHVRRDPRDIVVSIMHYRRLSFEQSLARLMGREKDPFLPMGYPVFVAEWEQEGVPSIDFEALVAHPEAAVDNALAALGIEPSEYRSVEDAVDWCNFGALLARFPERKGAMRAGRVGDWRHTFTRGQAELFHRHFGGYLEANGYTDGPGWVDQCAAR